MHHFALNISKIFRGHAPGPPPPLAGSRLRRFASRTPLIIFWLRARVGDSSGIVDSLARGRRLAQGLAITSFIQGIQLAI